MEDIKPEPIENSAVANPSVAPTEDEYVSDSELDELLDESLNEFGKHIPAASSLETKATPQSPTNTQHNSAAAPQMPNQPHPPLSSAEMEEMFSTEFAAEAEAQLDEAMKMFSNENPELWQQFESFAKSMGLDDVAKGPVPSPFGAASKGESSVDASSVGPATGEGDSAESPGKAEGVSSLDQKLDDTIKRMQENAARLGPDMNHLEGLGDMLSQLDLGSEEGEDHFMKMMQGMMSTLLSKEVLYPSLMDLCKQYPGWLASHRGKIPEEDHQRYTKQFEVMTAICKEFENPSEGEGATLSQTSSEKILQLMQQLQQYGQPPEDMAGENMLDAGIPSGLLGSGADSKNCTVM